MNIYKSILHKHEDIGNSWRYRRWDSSINYHHHHHHQNDQNHYYTDYHHQNHDRRSDSPHPVCFHLDRCHRPTRSELFVELQMPHPHQETSASTPHTCPWNATFRNSQFWEEFWHETWVYSSIIWVPGRWLFDPPRVVYWR